MSLVIDRAHAQFINDVTDVDLSQELELTNVVQAQFSGGLNFCPSAASRWIGFFDDLKELMQADLISQERNGRNLIYRAQFDRMNAVLTYLSQNCCQGDACEVSPEAICKTC